MKKINYIFTPLLSSLFFIAGCSEKKDNDNFIIIIKAQEKGSHIYYY